ncbi:DUF6520 family protein [Paraflavitalea speifideaquila]|uniref:DUF6520 family protein n=1 Tax=Paraflavitalea speifideaquila TaxID=3076558 RepID=UPI0028E796A8|nr:DUF6520 family protein [Paraflavitalea speifideiaquila]
MKKSRFSLMALAAVAALSSAFASKPDCLSCQETPQFHLNGTVYEALGQFGIDYDCDYMIDKTCTYYRPNPGQQPNVYAGCRLGIWIDLGARAQK